MQNNILFFKIWGGAILFLLFTNVLNAQVFECYTDTIEISESQGGEQPHNQQSCYNLNSCSSKKIKYSDNLENSPIVKVRLNFHFIKTGNYGLNFGDTTGNCSNCPNNELVTAHYVAQLLVDSCNARLANLQDHILYRNLNVTTNDGYYDPALPMPDKEDYSIPNLGDSRIRFELYDPDSLGAVHVHEVDSFRYAQGGLDSVQCRDNQVEFPRITWKDNLSVYGSNVIDIFFADEYFPVETFTVNDTIFKCRQIRGISNASSTIGIWNLWYYWSQSNGNIGHVYNQIGTVLHEVGHAMGVLAHPFESSTCCDAYEIPYVLTVNNKKFVWDISNNIMGYNGKTNALSPCQLDIMHDRARGTSRPYLHVESEEDYGYCSKQSGLDTITTNVVWTEDQVITKDILIKSGAKLEITGDICVGFAKDIKIHVERGALLYVHDDLGSPSLRTLCDDTKMPSNNMVNHPRHWGGIRVAGNPQRNHPEFYDDTFNIDGQDPGRVVIIGANIIEARQAIMTDWDLEYRPDFWGGFVYCDGVDFTRCHRVASFMRYRRPNKSIFANCTLQGYPETLQNTPIHGMGISAWDCRGITIKQCSFDLLQNYALFTINGDFKVLGGNTFKRFPFHSIYAGTSHHTLQQDVSLKIGSESHSVNYFGNNVLDIKIEGYITDEGHEIVNNEFEHPQADVYGNAGIEIIGSRIDINQNLFNKKYLGINLINNFNLKSTVGKNGFISPWYGIQYRGSNNMSQFQCNQFTGYYWAVWLNKGTIPHQGNQILENANQWYRTRTSPKRLDISTTIDFELGEGLLNSSLFSYYVETGTPTHDSYRPTCNLSHQDSCGNMSPQNYSTLNSADKINCSTFSGLEPDTNSLTIPELRELIDSIVQADTLYMYNQEYMYLSGLKHTRVMALVDSLIGLTLFSSADSVLAAEPEREYAMYRYGLKLDTEDFSGAESVLTTFLSTAVNEDDFDFVDVQSVNIKWQEDLTYIADSTERVMLEDISAKPTIPGGQARALLTWWFDMAWLPFIPEEEEEEEPEELISSLDKSDDLMTSMWKVFPNPGSGYYQLTNEKAEDQHIELALFHLGTNQELDFRNIHWMKGKTLELDYTALLPGLYILSIRNARDSISYLKIIKL